MQCVLGEKERKDWNRIVENQSPECQKRISLDSSSDAFFQPRPTSVGIVDFFIGNFFGVAAKGPSAKDTGASSGKGQRSYQHSSHLLPLWICKNEPGDPPHQPPQEFTVGRQRAVCLLSLPEVLPTIHFQVQPIHKVRAVYKSGTVCILWKMFSISDPLSSCHLHKYT